MKMFEFQVKYHWNMFLRILTNKKIGIGSGNGLAPNKQQFMTKPILIQFFEAICYH